MNDPSERLDDDVTSDLIDFVTALRADDCPAAAMHEATRAFVNAVGCILGGAGHALTENAVATLSAFSGAPTATFFGQGRKGDPLTASLLNGLSGAAYSFDDTYGEAMLHPGGPLAAALLALCEQRSVSGRDFLAAYVAGLETACRLTKALTVPPARGEMAWSQTGIVCGLASALAAGKLMGLDRARLESALAIATSEAAGTRAAHGSMAASLIFGRAAQSGLRAALLAENGFTGSARPLEHRFGFARVFAVEAHLPALVEGLGTRFELMENTYKPYPCGLVIHPSIDAVLGLREAPGFSPSRIARIRISASPAAIAFGWHPDPRDDIAAKVSLPHWVAVAVITGRAGLAEGRAEMVHDPAVRAMRALVEAVADPDLPPASVRVDMDFDDGTSDGIFIETCLGSTRRPMSDAELDTKFRRQAALAIGAERADELARTCWGLADLGDAAIVARLAA